MDIFSPTPQSTPLGVPPRSELGEAIDELERRIEGMKTPPPSEKMLTLMRSPAFLAWFRESKVVDSSGMPLVVYHGTNQNFSVFSRDRLGKNTLAASSIEFFFTENAVEAGEYAVMSARRQISNSEDVEKRSSVLQAKIQRAEARANWDEAEKLYIELENLELGAIREGDDVGQAIMPVLLRIENPKVMDMGGSFDGHVVAAAIRAAKAEGHDGMHLLNVFDPVGNRPEVFTTTQWVAFNPTQIKSAVGNSGAFDGENSDITA